MAPTRHFEVCREVRPDPSSELGVTFGRDSSRFVTQIPPGWASPGLGTPRGPRVRDIPIGFFSPAPRPSLCFPRTGDGIAGFVS
jgi:hypothetical protein